MQRDAGAHERNERARVQHLGAVVGDFGGFLVVQGRNHAGVGHEPGIGRQDAGHVLPEHDARGAERAAEHGGRQVGSAAAERGGAAVGGAADEARHDGHGAVGHERPQYPARRASGVGQVRRGAAVVVVGLHDGERVDGPRACRRPAARPPRARAPTTARRATAGRRGCAAPGGAARSPPGRRRGTP